MAAGNISRRQMLGFLGAATVMTGSGRLLSACGDSLSEDSPGGGAAGTGGGGRRSLKVGLLTPLSGVYGPIGTDMRNAWYLWLGQHDNLFGGLEVDTVEADEGEGPDTGVPAAERLLQQDGVDVLVGVVNSAVALGLKSVMQAAGKLFVVANAGANEITTVDPSPYVWRTSFTNSQMAYPMGKYLAEEQPEVAAGVFTIAADYAAGAEHVGGFNRGLETGGFQPIGAAFTPFATTEDFQPFLAQIQQAGPTAVYCFYAGAEAVGFVRQYADFGLAGEIPLVGSGSVTEGGVLVAQGPAAAGIRTSLHYATGLDNEANRRFVEDYAAANDGAATTFYALQAWDSALVLDRVVAATNGDLSGDALADALGGLDEIADSPRGPWRFDQQSPNQTYYIREVQDEGGALVNAVIADTSTVPPDV